MLFLTGESREPIKVYSSADNKTEIVYPAERISSHM